MSTPFRSQTEHAVRTEDLFSGQRNNIEQVYAGEQPKHTITEALQHGFDLNRQVQERPWIALGVAATAGYLLGIIGGGSQHNRFHDSPNSSLWLHADRRPLYGSTLPH